MRLLISSCGTGSGLTAINYVAAKRLLRERPVSVIQILQPEACRENLLGFLSWANGKQRLPSQVILNQVSSTDRRWAGEYLQNRGYRTTDRVTFIKLP